MFKALSEHIYLNKNDCKSTLELCSSFNIEKEEDVINLIGVSYLKRNSFEAFRKKSALSLLVAKNLLNCKDFY